MPDTTAPSAVPAAASPTGSAIPTVTHEPASTSTPVVPPATMQPSEPKVGKISVREALKLDKSQPTAREKADKMAADIKARHVKSTLPAARPEAKKPAPTPKPKPAAPPPENEDDPATKQPDPIAPEPPKPEPKKIKIGEREMTPEEIAAHIADLEAKAKKASEPPAEDPTAKAAREASEREQAQTEYQTKRKGFIEKTKSEFKPEDYGIDFSQQAFDQALATGDTSYFQNLIASTHAAAVANSREWAATQLEALREDLRKEFKPALDRDSEIRAYQQKTAFYERFPDIRGLEQWADNARKALLNHYADDMSKLTPEQFDEEVANQVRYHRDQILAADAANKAAANPQPPTPGPAPVAQPKPRPTPHGGNPPGGGGAPSPVNGQKALINNLQGY